LKPFIPRALQVNLRRVLVHYKLMFNKDKWPIDFQAAKKPVNWPGWPKSRSFALVLTHDVESYKGMLNCDQLIRLEMDLGFRSSYNFVPEKYVVSEALRKFLKKNGFEVGVHGLSHDGKLLASKSMFLQRSVKINQYLKEWKAVGFRAPAMHHNLEWFNNLDIAYDLSTFDTDPFEPQSDSVGTIFPFIPNINSKRMKYVEMPYTLPQDFTLFILLKEKNINIWKKKLDWIAHNGGMALVNTHPDYMNFGRNHCKNEEYTVKLYDNFLLYCKSNYGGQYWHSTPMEVARYYNNYAQKGYVIENRELCFN
jgi:peptidoglycan/xylan/chitin deacetylase (PgdA/CDA1 family)